MKDLFVCVLAIALVAGCSKDELLVEQYKPDFKANPVLSDNDCIGIVGAMIGEQSAVIYTGRYGLYTENDFNTIHYNEYGNSMECSGRPVFFDGSTVWLAYHESTLGWTLIQTTPGYSSTKEITRYHLMQGEFNSSSAVQLPTVFGADEMIFTSYSRTYIGKPEQIDVYSIIDYEVKHLSTIQSDLYPYRIFLSGNKYFLLAKEQDSYISQIPGPCYVYVSSNALHWDGPYMISANADIRKMTGGHDILTAIENANNMIFTSIDGGKTWAEKTIPLNGTVQDVSVPENNLIYAVVAIGEEEPHGPISKLTKSSDGGNTWKIMETELYGEKLSFFNKQHGIAIANGTLQVTHDGGETWRLILVSK